ncbi:MAG: hypothetical protein V7634_109 [Bradyrhizobium sp.]|jgi:uncharacterized membrane protein
MRRLMKFLHTMGAIGLMGAMACLLALLGITPAPSEELARYAELRAAMAAITNWVFFPSLGVTLVAGLLAIAVNRAYHSAGWALAKLATGVLVFEWGFAAVQGPMQEAAEDSARALAGQPDAATLAVSAGAERASLWIMLGVATVNVILGIWRPRLTSLPD